MKTAISVNDELMEVADRTARELGVSRSRLFSLAMQDFLKNLRREKIVAQLNAVYSGEPPGEERPPAERMKAKFRATIKDKW
jgi:hypothetical protein